MPNFVIAAIVIVGGIWLIRKMAKTPSAAMPALMKKFGGMGLIFAAAVVALRGNINAAVPLLLMGLGLIGLSSPFAQNFSKGWQKSEGQKSRVTTSILSMELDHDSGAMDGEVLQGPYAGRLLSQLAEPDLVQLHAQCKLAADHSRPLLEAWLDRNKPNWRTTWNETSAQPSSGGKMSITEAYAVLGLKPGASEDDIKTAHRRLMKEFHPDKGGSDYLAAKINQAKDVLLSMS